MRLDTENLKKDWKSLKKLWPYASPLRSDFMAAALSMAVVAALSSISMGLIKFLVDLVFIDNDRRLLVDLVWIVPILFMMKSFCAYLVNYLLSKIGHAMARSIRTHLVQRILFQDHHFHSKYMSADLMARATNDLTAVMNMTANVPLFVLRDGFTIFFLLGLIFYLNTKFALTIVGAIPVFLIIFAAFNASLRRVTGRAQKLVADIYSGIGEGLTGLSTIKVFLYEQAWVKRFSRQNEDHYQAMLKFQRLAALSPSLTEFLSGLVTAIVLFWGGLAVIHGDWSAGDFMAFLGAAFASYQPIKHLAHVNSVVQMGLASWNRIVEILETDNFIEEGEKGTGYFLPFEKSSLSPFPSLIEFRDVGFVYPGGRRVLQSINLKIAKGEILGVNGPSGSGKSTLVNLLPRFYDPAEGTILINGRPLAEWPLHDLRSLFALVTQDPFLFNDTLAANISMGKPGASLKEIEAAAEAAHAMEFIRRLPEGLMTIAGERGSRFSTGQRQRLCIARAILKNPQILIMDEATSNLDPESEGYILDALTGLLKNKTAIIISHHPKTLKNAHRIITVDAGMIAEKSEQIPANR